MQRIGTAFEVTWSDEIDLEKNRTQLFQECFRVNHVLRTAFLLAMVGTSKCVRLYGSFDEVDRQLLIKRKRLLNCLSTKKNPSSSSFLFLTTIRSCFLVYCRFIPDFQPRSSFSTSFSVRHLITVGRESPSFRAMTELFIPCLAHSCIFLRSLMSVSLSMVKLWGKQRIVRELFASQKCKLSFAP